MVISSRLRVVAVVSTFYLCVSLILRILLWAVFGEEASVGFVDFLIALCIGVLTDLHELVYITLPIILVLLFLPERIYYSRIFKGFVYALSFALVFGAFYLAAVEFFFFEEFDSRFNLIAVDYLIYPTEVLVNLWECYPIVWYLSAALLLAYFCMRFLWPKIRQGFEQQSLSYYRRAAFFSCHLVLVLVLALALKSDRVEFSTNRVAVEIGNNGLNSLFRAFRTQELDYDLYYKTFSGDKAYQITRDALAKDKADFVSADVQDLNRQFEGRSDGLGKMNVVVLCLESQGAGYVGAYGDKRGLTPHFDALAQRGLFFQNVYATGTRTVRGLEAISVSIPPIPSESVLKRPGNEDMATWGQVMQGLGYHTSFLYGGYGYFDNMNYFFGHNGFNLSDRMQIEAPKFGNIWGVSDEDLYRHAIKYYDGVAKEGKPFFSIVMSTSNHKPFTFPEGTPNVPATGGGRLAGVRYADLAVGRFVREASKHNWFKNTLLVIVADHDARVYGRATIPVQRYRIPLLMYSPKKLPAGVVKKRVSQMDIAPTVLDLLGLPYRAPFYGQSALKEPDQDNPIFLSHNQKVALLKGDKMVILGMQKSAKTYHYDEPTDDLTEIERDSALQEEAVAYYQSAFELFKSQKYKIK